jgi:hypothetical protein
MTAVHPQEFRSPSTAELIAAAGRFEDRALALYLDAEDSARARREGLLFEVSDADRASVFQDLCAEGKVIVDEEVIDDLILDHAEARLHEEARALRPVPTGHAFRHQWRAERLVALLLAAEELVAAADCSLDRGDLLQGAKSKLFGAWARCGGALVSQAHREAA